MFDLNPNNDVVLFFAGGEFGLGRNTTIIMLKALIRLFSKLQVVAISGRNQKMNEKFHKLVEATESQNRIKIIEFTDCQARERVVTVRCRLDNRLLSKTLLQ